MVHDVHKTIGLIRLRCIEMELEGSGRLYKYSEEQLATLYDFSNPELIPEWLDDVKDSADFSLAAPFLIHDLEWIEADGSMKAFTASNDRLRRNCIKVAKKLYGWYDPRRYSLIFHAIIISSACQMLGFKSWSEYAGEANSIMGAESRSKLHGMLCKACACNLHNSDVCIDPFD